MARIASTNGGTRGSLEASAYEVPLSSTPRPAQSKGEYESLEATYALPDSMYEYATHGPNEAKVFH